MTGAPSSGQGESVAGGRYLGDMTTLLGGPAAGSLLEEDEPAPIEAIGDSELNDRYVALRSRLTRLEAEAARLLAEIDRRRSFEPDHFTAEAFLQSRVGDSGRAARRNVAEARGLDSYEIVRQAFAIGEIDRPRVAMLLAASQVSPSHFRRDQGLLVDTATNQSMAGTHQAIEYWKQQVDIEAASAHRETCIVGVTSTCRRCWAAWFASTGSSIRWEVGP